MTDQVFPITEKERIGADARAAMRRCLAEMTTIPTLQATVLAQELWTRIAPIVADQDDVAQHDTR